MKKKKLNFKQLALKKSKVASLESNSVTGGFQSWTGTAEPCFSDFNCGTVIGCYLSDACPTGPGCIPPPPSHNCPTNNCPPTAQICNSDSICPPGVYCY